MLDALAPARLPARVPAPGQQPQADPGLLRRPRRSTDTDAVMRVVDKLDKLGRPQVRALLVDEAGADRRAGRRVPGAGRRSAPRTTPSSSRSGRSASSTSCSTRASPSSPRWSTAARRWSPTGSAIVADLKIARGLDYYTGTVFETRLDGLRVARLDLLAAAATTRSPATGGRRTPASASPSASAGCWCRCSRQGLVGGRPVGAQRRARRPRRRGVARAASDSDRRRAARPRDPLRGRRRPPQKFGKQIRYAERRGIPYVWFPAADGGHEVKDIRTGEQVGRRPEPPGRRRPRTCAAGTIADHRRSNRSDPHP